MIFLDRLFSFLYIQPYTVDLETAKKEADKMSFWNPFGFGKRKTNVTPEELGSLLFSLAARSVSKDLETPDLLQLVAANTANRDTFRQELLIVIMYAVVNVIMTKINPEDKASRILDAMNDAFINTSKPEFRPQMRLYIGMRYNEYQDAQQEKRGPNPLWPLCHHIFKNLLGKETITETPLDVVNMTSLLHYYSSNLIAFGKVVGNLRVTY